MYEEFLKSLSADQWKRIGIKRRSGLAVPLFSIYSSESVGIGEIPNARQALIGTEEDPGMLQHAADLIHSGRFYGNPKSMLCSASRIFRKSRW